MGRSCKGVEPDECETREREENCRAEEMEKKVQKMRLIYEGSRKMALALELDEIYNRALELACTALEADGGSVMILDEKTGELVVKAASGSHKEIAIGKRLKLGERFAGHAAQMKSPLFMHDVEDKPWFKSLKKFEEIKSGMSIPLLVKDKLVGVINLKRTQRDEKFAKNDVGLVSILADYVASIIERKRAEEALVQSKMELNQIFETATDAMRIIDRDFNVVKQNKTMSILSGIDKAEGIKCYDQLKGKLCHTNDCFLTRIVNGEDVAEIEIEKERPDGKKIPCLMSAKPFLDVKGNVIGVIEAFHNITERKRVEEERLKITTDKKRMEELEKFAKVAVGRELKMVELKRRIKELESKLEDKS